MTTLEDRLRGTLHDMADEAVAVPLLQRLENRPEVHPGRHRLVAVAAAAVAAAVAATTSYVVLRGNEPSIVEPVDRPPKVIRLADTATAAPGRVQLAVTLAPADANGFASTYAVGADGGPATLVPQSKWVPRSHTAHLTLDGTRLVWQLGDAAQPRLEVVNLRTGARDTLGGALGYCPQLSPDGRTIAMWGTDDERPALLDTRTRSQRPGPFDPALDPPVAGGSGCAGFGWSPDGRILLVPLTLGSLVSAPDGPI
ncbi:MAG: hypothetical protein ACRDV2_06865, partial [Actinomycetes bacterium]